MQMGKECEEQDYLVSYLGLSSLVLQVVKHRERGEFGETADIIRLTLAKRNRPN